MSDPVVCKNKAVYITYPILDQQGQVVEQSDVPIGYVHGADSGLFEQVEAALEGAKPGDKFEVFLPPEQGFGAHYPALTFTDDIENVHPNFAMSAPKSSFRTNTVKAKCFA